MTMLLKNANPELFAQLHENLNSDIDADLLKPYIEKNVYWDGGQRRVWQATVGSRPCGNDCLYCSGKKAIKDENDLGTVNPILAAQLHPTKNGNLRAKDITAHSGKKLWWICGFGHEWQAFVYNRSSGQGCPYCCGQKVIVGETDLATVNPILAAQLHPTKNGNLRAKDITAHSGKKLWWICGFGHEWQATVSGRSEGNGCPYCAGKKAIEGENDLATVNPILAAQLHPTKNGNLRAKDITAHSGKKLWWICGFGHVWQASVNNRSKGNECPFCRGNKVIVGKTDLGTVNPILAAQLHPTKNGILKATDIAAHSNKKVYWICEFGHEWQASVYNRSCSNGRGCPFCKKRKAIYGETDLATVNPILAAQLHPTKNGNLRAVDITAHSNKKVCWICEHGHEWEAKVNDRTNGSGCPFCKKKKAIYGETDLATVNPVLAAQLHPTKNGNLRAEDITAHSGKKLWWICGFEHEWQASVDDRSGGSDCPFCSGRRYQYSPKDLKKE